MKKIFLYLSFAIILLGIPITIFLVGRNQELRKRAAPASTLFITPATVSKKVGETFSLDIKLDPAANQVAGIQINLEYDPTKLKAEDITNGAMAPSILASGKIDPAGIVSIKVGAKSNAEPITEPGTVAVLTMTVLAASSSATSVKFSPPPDTYANALGEGVNNVLIGMTPATITLVATDDSSSQTENSLPTPIATLIATPTATPGGSLTPTPTAMDTSESTPSALTIDSIQSNENITTNLPTFSGKVQPGYTVTLTIYSEPRTVVVTVDANGNWTYTPQENLDNGPHTVVALAADPSTGQTQTTTVPFVINGADSTTESAIPVTGNTNTTLILIAGSIILFIVGTFVPFVLH